MTNKDDIFLEDYYSTTLNQEVIEYFIDNGAVVITMVDYVPAHHVDDEKINRLRRLLNREAECYKCKSKLNGIQFKKCSNCGWLICKCGACGCGYKV